MKPEDKNITAFKNEKLSGLFSSTAWSLLQQEGSPATPRVGSRSLRLSGAELLLSACNNLAASRKREKKIREIDKRMADSELCALKEAKSRIQRHFQSTVPL